MSSATLENFTLVCSNARLSAPNPELTAATACMIDAGVYVWTFIGDPTEQERVLYVGRTTSLKRRIRDYQRTFQPHSPNDYKLQAAQSFIRERYEEPTFKLYFRVVPSSELAGAEAQEIRRLSPLINSTRKASFEAVESLRESFSAFYSHFLRNARSADSDA